MNDPTPDIDDRSPLDELKEIARRSMEELWNQGRLEAAEEFLSHDFIDHDPAARSEIGGIEGEKALVTMFREAFSDLELVIEDLIAENDQVAIRWTARGTHRGEFQGIPPPTAASLSAGSRSTGSLRERSWSRGRPTTASTPWNSSEFRC